MKKRRRSSKGGYAVKIGRKNRRFRLKTAARKAMRAARARGRKVGSIHHVARLAAKKPSRRSRRVRSNRRRSRRVRSNRRRSVRRRSRR